MPDVISQQIPYDYQITELRADTNGQNRATSKVVDPAAARIKQAEDQIEVLSRFFYAYPAAMAALSSNLDPEGVFDAFVQEMVKLLDTDSCHIYRWDGAVSLMASSEVGEKRRALLADEALRQSLTPLVKRAIVERLPVQYALAQPAGYSSAHSPLEAGTRTLLLVPMASGEEKLTKVVVVESREKRVFTRHEILCAQRFAFQAVGEAEKARQYKDLVTANSQLEASNEALESFAHIVAHDLKGPLATIIGSAEFLKLADENWPSDDLEDLTTIISESSHKMLGIINGLLLLAAVGKQNVEITQVDMNSALAEAQSRLDGMINKEQAEINISPDLLPGWGYRPWVEQVWTNLLSNAVKYGGQPPIIKVGSTKMADGTIRYWVKDNGQGLTEEQQARLFKPFTRLHNKSISGHGLGLSISRRIVDRLGGEIGVESEPGQGCIFFFTLPGNA